MDTKTNMLAESKEISSSQSVDMPRKRKILFGLFLGFQGLIVGFILIYTSKRMAFETWETFLRLFLLVIGLVFLVCIWIESKRK